MRCAVVGHVEWTEFARVPAVPRAGEIVHATELWEEPGGGGAVIAAQLAKLAGRCELFTALGDDALGHRATRRLAELGVGVYARYAGTTRRALTHVDDDGERTITVLGDKLLPHDPPPLHHGYDLVFFVSGDAGLEVSTVVRTRGAEGGDANGVPFRAAPAAAPTRNAYGAGHSFAAALAFGLARGDALEEALALAARAGAAVLAGPTPYAAQLEG